MEYEDKLPKSSAKDHHKSQYFNWMVFRGVEGAMRGMVSWLGEKGLKGPINWRGFLSKRSVVQKRTFEGRRFPDKFSIIKK
jgi:hypothetical protein